MYFVCFVCDSLFMNRLAIIDWGIGGISIYKLVQERLGVPVTYFSDTGVTPYGKMSLPELVARLNLVIPNLKDRGVTHLVIGCNAASTVIPYLDDQGIKIEGMIETAVAETLRHKPTKLGLIGGRRTVISGVYRRVFAANGVKVTQRIAQPLSALIESGDTSSEAVRVAARRILAPIRNCSHILLACTHYPAILPLITGLVSSETTFIDPASELVNIISRWQIERGDGDVFLTSGDKKEMKKAAKAAFGVTIGRSVKIAVELPNR